MYDILYCVEGKRYPNQKRSKSYDYSRLSQWASVSQAASQPASESNNKTKKIRLKSIIIIIIFLFSFRTLRKKKQQTKEEKKINL